MAAIETLFLFVLGPLLAWVGGSGVAWRAFGELQTSAVSRGLAPPSAGRFALFAGSGAAPVALGVVLWTLGQPIARSIEAGVASPAPLDLLLRWAGIAYFVASCTALAAQGILLTSRLSAAVSQDKGRILVVYVIPVTAVVFALVIDFQLFGIMNSVVVGTRVLKADAVDVVSRSFAAFALGTLGFPAAALASRRIRELSGRGFRRILLVFEAGELPVVLGLALGLSAMGSL